MIPKVFVATLNTDDRGGKERMREWRDHGIYSIIFTTKKCWFENNLI